MSTFAPPMVPAATGPTGPVAPRGVAGRVLVRLTFMSEQGSSTPGAPTAEMAAAAGEENFFLFGLTAEEVAAGRSGYDPLWHYEREPQTRAALELIAQDHFSAEERGVFTPILDALLKHGDYYMHLADLTAYTRAHAEVAATYGQRAVWVGRAIRNVAASGAFSSDRAIRGYARDIWGVAPCTPTVGAG